MHTEQKLFIMLEEKSISSPAQPGRSIGTPESRQTCSNQSKSTSPNDWPVHKKLAIVVATFLSVINSGIGTSLPSNAVPYIMREFHVEDATQSNLPTSVFLIGYIVGPLAFSPLSETIGRRLVLLPTITVFTLSTVACALSPNWGSLLFFRFICGTMGSAPQTVVGGVYADMFFDLRERGRVMAFYMASASFGPILGPIISGFASPSYGWRWTFWIGSILAGCAWICLLFMPETFGPVLSRGNATGMEDTASKNTVNVVQIVKRPLAMLLFEPIITFTSIYIALAYGLVFFYFQAYPIIFEGLFPLCLVIQRMLTWQIVGVGAASTSLVALYWDMTYDKAKKHNKPWRFGAELHRLPISCLGAVLLTASSFWLAWTSRAEVHWATIFVSLLTYVTDAYKIYSASALASSVILRSVLGALLPLAAKPMYATLGVSWATSLVGFLSLACVPIPFVLLYKGEGVRERSKFCQQLMKQEWANGSSDTERGIQG
ncbi:putative MFS multidrug transporter [Aspergillus novofumigatus IBT 16806]|uniref:Putative MFS transporter n=1 Tax=Aspergillus novofumigatus (strain IBT 16806) TaxID=1392255 RepID=A0A2I1BYQ0_ASPN1|nr:putative MFS transporter [Aspergillus novofumigatus IBT 16806]PKX90495.1 putative MFS transporter [Aspergillus novofumigatus IBT 16806]